MAAKKTAGQSEASGNLQHFETDFTRLGEIVSRLEVGNIPLEEMLKLYEEGMQLSGRLSSTLNEAELRVETLAKAHEEMGLEHSRDSSASAKSASADDAAAEDFLLEE